MTTKNRQTCLSAEMLRKLSHDELSPTELEDVEEHVSGCDRCRTLLEVAQGDPQWREEIVPILRAPADSPRAAGDHDDGGNGEPLESIFRMLGPTDDPHMLGRIGPYEVVGVIGRGGMGVVFKAYEGALNRFVAIKLLLPHLVASGAARKRFAREGRAAAAVIDDNVMPIYSVAEWQGVPYLVTQYSRGATLQKRIQDQGPLELKEMLRIGMQTARGLAAAHAQGLIHRDVKPSNILLDGTVERALLTDFGLARAVDDASITRTGIVAGTPQYMSPEQANGDAVDHRSDLFSLGSVLYAMCTGRPPFRGETTFGVLRRIRETPPRPIREINADIPEWFERIVMKLLAKSPAKRFATATEVAKLLEQCLAHVQQPTTVVVPDVLGESQREVDWTRVATRLCGAAAGLLTVFTTALGCAVVLRSATGSVIFPVVTAVAVLIGILVWHLRRAMIRQVALFALGLIATVIVLQWLTLPEPNNAPRQVVPPLLKELEAAASQTMKNYPHHQITSRGAAPACNGSDCAIADLARSCREWEPVIQFDRLVRVHRAVRSPQKSSTTSPVREASSESSGTCI